MQKIETIGDAYLWIEQEGSIHIKASTKEGDPLELTADEAKELRKKLLDLADRLDQLDIKNKQRLQDKITNIDRISEKNIQTLLRNGNWIDLNSITYKTGEVLLLEVNFFEGNKYPFQIYAESTISSCIKHARECYSALDIYDQAVNDCYTALIGAGSYEDSGFIHIKHSETGGLQWLAFFCSSSPFKKITEFNLEYIEVLSDDGMTWRFDINSPESIRISKTT